MNATINKIPIELDKVQKTLLIPLYGRAKETQKKEGMLNDKKAVEIVNSLDYDFSKMDNKPSLIGASLRTLSYDYLVNQIVDELLKTNKRVTIVELGCGLNTRRYRLKNIESINWFDLDMPDVYKLWQQFFDSSENHTFLPYSAFDEQWVKPVQQKGDAPVIFISEASTIYFSEEENKKLFEILSTNFPNSYYIFDTATKEFINNQENHDILRFFEARLQWEVNDIKEVENWNSKYENKQSLNFFTDTPQEYKKYIPFLYKIYAKMASLFFSQKINQYQLNVFKFNS